jgi:4'-phosphopantetheinyl transferase
MIRWLVQTVVDHPDLSAGRPPARLLTRAESAQYRGYLSPRHRRDWLLGRWTAKRLIQAHIMANDGFRPALNSFTIEHEPSGAPYSTSHHPALQQKCDDGRMPLALSISHSNGYAFCALCDDKRGDVRLGADIELVEPRADDFTQNFLTADEQASLNAAPSALHDLLVTATWSAKEAVLKTTHLGLRADPRTIQCILHPARPRHWTPFYIEIEPAMRAQTGGLGPLRAWWRVIENRLRRGTFFVLTLAACGPDKL